LIAASAAEVATLKVQPAVVSDRSSSQVAGVAVLVSLFSFLYYFQHGDLLLYCDAVAHINIARRVFDSLTPGPLQLGTVWLPLPHVLMMPFIFPDALWQNGVGGSIPSMIAYVLAVMGIFRLARTLLEADERTKPAAGLGACTAAFAFGANPNLMYMQATAMTETIYLAFFVWAVVYFSEFIRSLRGGQNFAPDSALDHDTRSSLLHCAACLAGAELTRYDGWILASVIGAATVVIALSRWQNQGLRRLVFKFVLLVAVAPVLWLAYNAIVYRNPLEFANGPYSAKAIEQHFQAPNPALHNAPVAALYFLKSGQLNMAIGNWGRLWLAAALMALAIALWKLRGQTIPLLLLWVPLVFYALSIAYGSVPIHVSTWWPFATFNQRYGIQLLPMFAVSAGVLTAFVFLAAGGKRHGAKVGALMFALIAVSYFSVWKATPECLKEAQRNWDIRHALNDAVQRAAQGLPRSSVFLMDLGEHVGVMQQAGIPLRHVVNGENHRPWKKPSDPEGLWERALADPQRYVDYIIAFDGDPVDQTANRANLKELMEIHATGQPRARIYATGRAIAPNQSR
jgi:hypothetical protein